MNKHLLSVGLGDAAGTERSCSSTGQILPFIYTVIGWKGCARIKVRWGFLLFSIICLAQISFCTRADMGWGQRQLIASPESCGPSFISASLQDCELKCSLAVVPLVSRTSRVLLPVLFSLEKWIQHHCSIVLTPGFCRGRFWSICQGLVNYLRALWMKGNCN